MLAMVLQYAVGGSLLPFLTLLLRDRGLSVAQISGVLLVSSASLLVSPFFWGMFADRFLPMERVFVMMNGLAAAALVAFALQAHPLGLLVTFTLFYACYQPAPILVNALALRHLRDPYRQFAALRAWGSLGWILPSFPIFLVLAFSPRGNLEFIQVITMLCCLGMVGVSMCLPHTPPGAVPQGVATRPAIGYGRAVRQLLRNPNYLVVLSSYFLVSASFAIQSFYSPPRLEDLGMPRPWIGLVQSVGVVWEIALFRWQAAIVNRLGFAGSVAVGCLALVLRQVLFAWVDNLWVLSASYLLVGTTVVLYHIGVGLLVDAIAGVQVKATAQTLLVLCSSGLGPMFANAAVQRLMAGRQAGLDRLFLFAAGLAALATLVIFARGKKLREPAGIG